MIQQYGARHCPTCPICGHTTDAFATCSDEILGDPPHEWWGGLSPEEITSGAWGWWVHFNTGDEHRVTLSIYDSPDLTPDTE